MCKLLHILFFFVPLTIAMSCGRGVDNRLVIADSLMWTNPDSSLAILNAIDRDSLSSDENLAYHALLLTQAQFRVDYAIPSDSLISMAVEHFSDNNNRERYTRALLYKGAYYEVHDNPVEAMKWYKQAEYNADSTDYRNLAQIYLRMGMLYYNNYASNNLDLEKIKRALYYYRALNDKTMTMFCVGIAGNLCRESKGKEAVKYLTQAKGMAIDLNDTTSYYYYLNELSMAYFLDSLFVEAKDAAMECVNNTTPTKAMLFNAANAYAALGNPDSAKFYLAKIDTVGMSDYDRMMEAYAKGHIHSAESQEKESLYYQNLGTAISDTIKAKSHRESIYETETTINNDLNHKRDRNFSKYKFLMEIVVAFFLIVIILTIIHSLFKNRKYKALVNELNTNQYYASLLVSETKFAYEQLGEEQHKSTALMQEYRLQQKNLEFLNQYFNSFNSLLNNSYKMKREDFFREFEGIIKEASGDEHYWDIIIDVADKKSDGLISQFINNENLLSKNEKKILCLVCLGYNNDAIATSTGSTKDSIKTLKSRIRKKINTDTDENLDAYVKRFVSQKNATS